MSLIVDLETVFLPSYLGATKKIKNYNTTLLTAPGENYGSLMLAVDLTVEDTKTKDEQHLNVVAKMVPENEFVQKIFQSPTTFRKELGFYSTIIPELQEFQRKQGMEEVVDFFPKFYGGRLGLTNQNEFDRNALILLENLKIEGFRNVERTLGFDLETSKLILRDLAKLHAVPIALKVKQPKVFENKIKSYLNSLKAHNEFDEFADEKFVNAVLEIAKEDPLCSKQMERIEKTLRESNKFFENPKAVEPFATLNHCDFWVNNTLVKFDDNNKPVKNKIVDFQVTNYGSPAIDLTFFLFVSVQNEIIENKYDELLNEYYTTFLETLRQLDVDTTLFPLEVLEKEMKVVAKEYTFMQCCAMLKPIFATKDNVKNVEEISEKDFTECHKTSQLHKDKQIMIIREFLKRNWI